MASPNSLPTLGDLPWRNLIRTTRGLLAKGGLVAILVGFLSIFLPNYYKSEARILPMDSKGMSGMGGIAAAAAAFGVGTGATDGPDANFVDMVQSRTLREDLLNTRFTFHERDWRFGGSRLRSETLYQYLKVKNMDQGVQALGSLITCNRDLKSKIITISVETKSPELSQQLVVKTCSLLDSLVTSKSRKKGGNKAAFVAARLSEARMEMDNVESRLRGFLAANRNFLSSSDPSVRLVGERLEGELKLKQQMVVTLSVSYEQALLEEKNDIPILNILDAGNCPQEKSRPARSAIVLSSLFVAVFLLALYENREFLWASILQSAKFP